MKFIITESQYKKFVKTSPLLTQSIVKYLNNFISKGSRKIGQKSRNYGNLHEDWCVNGQEVLSAHYFFDDGKFDGGSISVDSQLVKTIMELFNVRKTFVLNIIEEWYDEFMVPKFEEIVGESGLYISEIDIVTSYRECLPEPSKPEGISDEEMIEFIYKNTAYTHQDVINKIQSGERELEDFYLDIVDTVNRKKQLGF